jgi:hypothetical protein
VRVLGGLFHLGHLLISQWLHIPFTTVTVAVVSQLYALLFPHDLAIDGKVIAVAKEPTAALFESVSWLCD